MAVATGRSQFAVATELADYRGVDARVVTRPPQKPRARRPGAMDALRAGPGGGVRPVVWKQAKNIENQPLAPAVYGVVAI